MSRLIALLAVLALASSTAIADPHILISSLPARGGAAATAPAPGPELAAASSRARRELSERTAILETLMAVGRIDRAHLTAR